MLPPYAANRRPIAKPKSRQVSQPVETAHSEAGRISLKQSLRVIDREPVGSVRCVSKAADSSC
jgi:hypothetical protein